MNRKHKNTARNLRRLRYGSASVILTVIVIAVVLLLNIVMDIVADRYPLTLDLSEDKVFTLSDESVAIAQSVKNDVEIIVFKEESFFTDPVPGSITEIVGDDATAIREFHTALQQYRTHSDNKVTYKFIDPDLEPEKFAPYQKYRTTNVDILFLAGERYKTSSLKDICSTQEEIYNEYATYGYYTFQSKVEKVLGSNINNLQSENDHIVQVLMGHSENEQTISGLKTLYELNGYTFKTHNITSAAAFDEKAEVLLIAAPTQDYTDAEITRVKDWMFNKGAYNRHLIIYVDPYASCPNLYELLDVEYGIQVTNELILETDDSRKFSYYSYDVLCDVPSTKFTANSANTGALATSIARRLTTTLEAEAPKDGAIANLGTILNNYPQSTQVIQLDALSDSNAGEPVHLPENQYPLTSLIATTINSYDNNTGKPAYGTVVVSGCPAMAYTEYVQHPAFRNEELLLDTINSVTGYENSVTISNKVFDTETFTMTPETAKIIGLWIFTFGVPAIVLIICLVVFLRRKHL